MTQTVIRARLQAAGLDPSLFAAADLERIGAIYRQEILPVPLPPTMAVHLPLPDERALADVLEALCGTADRCLKALSSAKHMLAFSGRSCLSELAACAAEISALFPQWEGEAYASLAALSPVCGGLAADAERLRDEQRELACCYAAAVLRAHPAAAQYREAVDGHAAAIEAVERQLRLIEPLPIGVEHLFTRALPALLETMPPLAVDENSFSSAACRRAALTLRTAAYGLRHACRMLYDHAKN